MTRLNVAHRVRPDQLEPGLPDDQQAAEHLLQFDLMGLDTVIAFALNRRIELTLEIPTRWALVTADFLSEDGQRLTDFQSIHHRTETISGFADPVVQGRYRLSGSGGQRLRFDVMAGMSLPFGGIQPDPFALGRQGRSHQHLFFGTGTFDPRLSLELEYAFSTLAVLSELRWQGSLYANRENYTGPKQFTGTVGLRSRLGRDWIQGQLTGDVRKEWAARWGAERAENSGRLEVAPSVGLVWLATSTFSVFTQFRRPIILKARGARMSQLGILTLGAMYSIDTGTSETPAP